MITNEQILEILNTWAVSSASIYSNSTQLRLKNNNYSVWFTMTSYDSKKINFSLFTPNSEIGSDDIIFETVIPNEIYLEVNYLVTKKAENYVKSKLIEIFSDNTVNSLGALISNE